MQKIHIFTEENNLNTKTLSVYKSDLDYFDKWIKSCKYDIITNKHKLIQDFHQYQLLTHVNTGTINRRLSVIKNYHPIYANNRPSLPKSNSHLPERFMEDFLDYLAGANLEKSSIHRYLRQLKNSNYLHSDTIPIVYSHITSSDMWLTKFLSSPKGEIYSHLFLLNQVVQKDFESNQSDSISTINIKKIPSEIYILLKSFFSLILLFCVFILILGIFSISTLPKNVLAIVPNTLPKKVSFGISMRLKSNSPQFSPPKVLEVLIQGQNTNDIQKCTINLNNELDMSDIVYYFNSKNCSNSFQKLFLANNYLTFQINNDHPSYPPQKIGDLQNPSYFAYQNNSLDSTQEKVADYDQLIFSLQEKMYSTPSAVLVSSTLTPSSTPSATLAISPLITPHVVTPSP